MIEEEIREIVDDQEEDGVVGGDLSAGPRHLVHAGGRGLLVDPMQMMNSKAMALYVLEE